MIQGVGMLAVAFIVMATVEDRSQHTHDRLDILETELDEIRRQRDRMQRLSAALTEELDEAAVEAEIVRWQLAYTEERLARLRDASETETLLRRLENPNHPVTASTVSVRPLPPLGTLSYGRELSPPATFVSLDNITGANPDDPDRALDPATAVLAMLQTHTATDAGSPLGPAWGTGAAPFDLDPLDDVSTPAALQSAGSQLDRDRAFAVWATIVDEAAAGECARRSEAAKRRCTSRVQRQLMPWGGRAVECILSGNASADYVSEIRLDQLPTHSVPLASGAVILCDGGLSNLQQAYADRP
jgi:hypothetical protein